MNISIEWLLEFVPVDNSPQEIAHRLTMAGFEVETVEETGGDIDRLLAVEVKKIKPHPNADKLKICEVNTGEGTVEVICGAPNVAEGMRAVWAPPGTMLPSGQAIEETVIRGARSMGMLCSLQELGLEEKSAGIHELGPQADVGAHAAPLVGLNMDTVLEVAVLPNRPDALSVIGIAREVAALFDKELKLPPVDCPEQDKPIEEIASLEIIDTTGCPRYVARVIEDIKIGHSPAWMQRRLEASGVRAINNIVDVTNYVMLEMGQPLHAFDMDRLSGPGIVVRRSKAGERFITLDNVERMLEDDLLICDIEKPVALAGVMGGLNSEVTRSTTNVLLESACFNPSSIRRTSKRLGLASEASYRFERGVDPCLQLKAADRATALMAELAGGNVAKGAFDDSAPAPQPPEITVRDDRVELYLGISLPRKECKKLLESIELEVKETNKGFTVSPPSWRGDMNEEADVIEEVARLYGYDRLPVTLPEGRPEPVIAQPEDRLESRIKNALVGAGYHEIITLSFMNPDHLDRLLIGADDPRRRTVSLMNPLSSEEGVMRTTLIAGMLETAAYNLKRFQEDIKLFEIGHVFLEREGELLPHEPTAIAGIMVPPRKKRFHRPEVHPFYQLKGAVEEVLGEFKEYQARFDPTIKEPYLLPGECSSIYVERDLIGVLGRVRPSVCESFDVEEPAFVFELDFGALLKLSSRISYFEPLAVHPPAFRDIAVVVKNEIAVEELKAAITKIKKEVREVRVFDVYRGKQVPDGHKSVAFSVVYQWPDRSPVDEEVNKLHTEVIQKLEKQFGARIR